MIITYEVIPNTKKFVLWHKIDWNTGHTISECIVDEIDFLTMQKIKNYKNKTKYDFANEKFADFEPLGVVPK